MFVSVVLSHKVQTDNSGAYYELPVLHTEAGHIDQLLDYCIEKFDERSLSWMRKLVYAMQLFLAYMHTNPHERDTGKLFQNFKSRLKTGTFNPETGLDPSRLGWKARNPGDVKQFVGLLSDFFDWLGERNPNAAKINPRISNTVYDNYIQEAAVAYRRNRAFLGHLWDGESNDSMSRRRTKGGREPKIRRSEPPAFPEDRFEELLEKGFKVGGRINYRDQLITLLMHGAGFRVSEPMHLFLEDVKRDPENSSKALVLIHHPELGKGPMDLLDERGRPIDCNRARYLQLKYGLTPRNLTMSKMQAGWKNPALDDKYFMRSWWFIPHYGEVFMEKWMKYMEQVADIAMSKRFHPYAFMNVHREPIGSVYRLDKFSDSHGAACERIGLTVSKELGTTPHGHRHAYGRRLAGAGVHPRMIQRFMHHSNQESQEVYTGATTQEMIDELQNAQHRMEDKIRKGSSRWIGY